MRIDELEAAGFARKVYEGQEGTFLVKEVGVEHLSASGADLIDGDVIVEGMRAITEVCPDGHVQLYIPDADYLVGPYPFNSKGAQALLRDAAKAE